jgi:hypothetical protein
VTTPARDGLGNGPNVYGASGSQAKVENRRVATVGEPHKKVSVNLAHDIRGNRRVGDDPDLDTLCRREVGTLAYRTGDTFFVVRDEDRGKIVQVFQDLTHRMSGYDISVVIRGQEVLPSVESDGLRKI